MGERHPLHNGWDISTSRAWVEDTTDDVYLKLELVNHELGIKKGAIFRVNLQSLPVYSHALHAQLMHITLDDFLKEKL
jgi:hypothetical protein